MYRVIRNFHDLEDFTVTKAGRIYHEYKAGEVYPRKGVTPSGGRIGMLMSSENALGTPLIEPLATAPAEEPAAAEEPAEEAKPKKTRKSRTEK